MRFVFAIAAAAAIASVTPLQVSGPVAFMLALLVITS